MTGRSGIRAKKSPEAIGLILACLRAGRSFLLPVDRARARDAGPAVRPGGRRARCSRRTGRAARARPACARWSTTCAAHPRRPESEWPPAGGGDDVTFMLTTSGSTGLPKIVPLTASGVDAFTDWAAEQFEIRPGTVVANYAPLNFDLCLLDIWTTLKHGGTVAMVDQDRATQGAYLADLVNENQVNVLQAVPMLYRLLIDVNREDGTDVPERAARDHHRRQDPGQLAGGAAQAVPQRPLLQHLRLHRDQRQPDPRVPGAGRGQRAVERPGRPAAPRRDRSRAARGRKRARGRRHRRVHGLDAVPDPGLPEVVPERGQVRHARGRRAGAPTTSPATSSVGTRTGRSRSRAAPTSTSRCAASASRLRSSSRPSRSTRRWSRSRSSRCPTSWPAPGCMPTSAARRTSSSTA